VQLLPYGESGPSSPTPLPPPPSPPSNDKGWGAILEATILKIMGGPVKGGERGGDTCGEKGGGGGGGQASSKDEEKGEQVLEIRPSFIFSREKGFLLLPQVSLQALNVSVCVRVCV